MRHAKEERRRQERQLRLEIDDLRYAYKKLDPPVELDATYEEVSSQNFFRLAEPAGPRLACVRLVANALACVVRCCLGSRTCQSSLPSRMKTRGGQRLTSLLEGKRYAVVEPETSGCQTGSNFVSWHELTPASRTLPSARPRLPNPGPTSDSPRTANSTDTNRHSPARSAVLACTLEFFLQEKAKDRERELARAKEDEEYARAAAAKRSAATAAVSPGGQPQKRARMTAAALMDGEEDIVMDYGSDKVSRAGKISVARRDPGWRWTGTTGHHHLSMGVAGGA